LRRTCGIGYSFDEIICGGKEQKMAGLSADGKNRIPQILDATSYRQRGFAVKFDDEKNPVATIYLLSSPEYRFIISSAANGAFTTTECPGIHRYEAETFQRSDFGACANAIREWVERISDR
jgi:hypothetical protein